MPALPDDDLELTVGEPGAAGPDELEGRLRFGRPEFGHELDGLRARMAALARGKGAREVGRYRLGRVLGSGAFGTVYVAEDPELDRRVAVKLLLVRTDRERARVLREARLLATLSHPNVVQVFEVGTIDEGRSPYVVMELVEGVTLREWLAERSRSWREVVEVGLGAARGLQAAHREGIVHRDFKPDNLLIGPDRRPRVIDFGLARPIADDEDDEAPPTQPSSRSPQLTATGQVMGTPAYMAPEMFAGTTTPLSDQYCLCVTLYEGLFGRRPYEAKTTEELRELVFTGEVPRPDDRRGVPRSVLAIVMRGLSKAPEDRFADLGQLCAALEGALRPPRWGRAGMALAGAGALAAVGVAVVAAAGNAPSEPLAAVSSEPAPREEVAEVEASEVVALRAELERLRDLVARSQQGEALELSQTLLERARALEHRPLLVDALLLRGKTLVLATDYGHSIPVLEEAYFLAEDEGLPQQAAHAASEVVGVRGYQADQYELAHRWQAHADAAFERAGLDPLQHVPYVMSVAGLAAREGERDKSVGMLREALARVAAGEHARSSEHAALLRAVGRQLYVDGAFEEARELMREAVVLYAENDGEQSVTHAAALDGLGVLLTELGRPEEALREHERAFEIRKALLEPLHMDLARSHGNLGRTLGILGRHDEAIEHLSRSIEIFSERLGPGNAGVALGYEQRGLVHAERGPVGREQALRDLDKAARIFDGAGVIYVPTAERVREEIRALGGTPPPAPSVAIPP